MNAAARAILALDTLHRERQAQAAEAVVSHVARLRSMRTIEWWRWTCYLAAGISCERIRRASALPVAIRP